MSLFFSLDKLTIIGVAATEMSRDFLCKCLKKIANDPISNLRVSLVETPGNKLVRISHEIIKICHNNPRCAETLFTNIAKRILEIIKHYDFKKPRRHFIIRRRTAGYEICSKVHNILIIGSIRKSLGVILTSEL